MPDYYLIVIREWKLIKNVLSATNRYKFISCKEIHSLANSSTNFSVDNTYL